MTWGPITSSLLKFIVQALSLCEKFEELLVRVEQSFSQVSVKTPQRQPHKCVCFLPDPPLV